MTLLLSGLKRTIRQGRRQKPLMKKNRLHERHIRRLETDFYFEDKVFKGISSNLSEKGLFIRTSNCLTPGSHIEFMVYLKDGGRAHGTGLVRRAAKSNSPLIKNGMGIELRCCDLNYVRMLEEVIGEGLRMEDVPFVDGWKPAGPGLPPKESRIVVCAVCGVKNRVPLSRMSSNPKCGRCSSFLPI